MEEKEDNRLAVLTSHGPGEARTSSTTGVAELKYLMKGRSLMWIREIFDIFLVIVFVGFVLCIRRGRVFSYLFLVT